MPTWQQVPRHGQWRRSFICRAALHGAAKKSYSSEKNSPKVYF
jgi:hypothetical protein